MPLVRLMRCPLEKPLLPLSSWDGYEAELLQVDMDLVCRVSLARMNASELTQGRQNQFPELAGQVKSGDITSALVSAFHVKL